MKKLFITIGLILTSLTFFIVKTNATTETWIETETINIEIEIDFSEMSAEQVFKLFSFLYDNNFIFENGEYQVDWINFFEINKMIQFDGTIPIYTIIIQINNEFNVVSLYQENYIYDQYNYFNWVILNGTIEIPKEIYNNVWVNGYGMGYADGENVGYGQGYGDGHNDGYNYGYDIGYNNGSYDGYNNGLTNGYNLGYEDGILVGAEQGYIDGFNKGKERGEEKGYIDGFNQGREEEKIISRNIYAKYYNGEWLTAEEYANLRVQQTINEIGNADDNKIGLIGFIPAILGSIGAFFFTLASFEVMGISLMSIITLFASLAVIILIIKLIKGGD